jgi:predicted CXXCH cytochrome family protein
MMQIVRAIIVSIVLVAAGIANAGVADSLHNLSTSGRGASKSAVAVQMCEFCHISHAANPVSALWNRGNAATTYIPYSSSTAVARPGQPTGTSMLCLSCHDGTIALGQILSRGKPIPMTGGSQFIREGKSRTGTDLRDDHPISFEYSDQLAALNGELRPASSISRSLPLDRNGELQCTTCHDAHDSPYGALLRVPNIGSQICTECHDENGWSQTSHSLSAATWNGRRPDPWNDSPYTTVRDNGCENCHIPHSVAAGPRLLRFATEEDNCADCHNGNVASADVMAVMEQASAHRVADTTMVHDPVEPAIIETRHVECADCHDPHATRSERVRGDVPANVRGVSIAGGEVGEASRNYEICLRCHGDSPDQPIARTQRQLDQTNMRLKIQLDNPSFHPIAGNGRNSDVPSLITPMTESTVIGCIDCHNSNSAASAGGAGPEGPHGSVFEPILVRNYLTLDNTPESASNYALCYGCHSRDSILNDESFSEHDKHIRGEDTPCNACHDPHGISNTQGTDTNNSHLINFDTRIVSPNSNGDLFFVDEGNRAGSCSLSCHGEDHDNFNY